MRRVFRRAVGELLVERIVLQDFVTRDLRERAAVAGDRLFGGDVVRERRVGELALGHQVVEPFGHRIERLIRIDEGLSRGLLRQPRVDVAPDEISS